MQGYVATSVKETVWKERMIAFHSTIVSKGNYRFYQATWGPPHNEDYLIV